MIVPLTEEKEWLALLANVPEWKPPANRLLVIAPHPDDETLGAGGLIQWQRSQGVEVAVLAVTDGEHAYAGVEGLDSIRRPEQTEALHRLGVPSDCITRLGLTDSGVPNQEAMLTKKLLGLTTPQTHLIAPWTGDFHPDHQACGRAAEEVARATGAQLTYYFFWTWHFGDPQTVAPLSLLRFPLSPPLLEAKLHALSAHQSQLVWKGDEPVLPERLLGPAKRPFEIFTPAAAMAS